MPALQVTADKHLSRRIDAVNLKHRLGDVETDCRDRLHAWLPITATAPAAITSMALTRRCGSRPQHQQRSKLPCGLRGDTPLTSPLQEKSNGTPTRSGPRRRHGRLQPADGTGRRRRLESSKA